MKHKFLVGIFCIIVLFSAVGCSSDSAQSKEPPDYYAELITTVKEALQKKDPNIMQNDIFSIDLLISGSYGIPGYLTEDLDGNGTDELIFGITGNTPNNTWDGIIYDIYTISDGEPIHVLNGWKRNRYYLCENGMIANEGSSGAANSSYDYFTFEDSKLHLVESVIYDGTRDAENPWLYSTESVFDAEKAEPISEKRAIEIRESYIYKYPAFIPFVPIPD